jgi:putative PIN family toxin of toxin-antitoxin system
VRAVADTNVYISALNFGGTAEGVLALARAGTVTLFVSSSILDEVEGSLIKKFEWSARSARDAITAIRGFTTVVRPREVVRVIVNDDPDNRILECAVEARADVVITGDHDLRQLGAFRNIRIQSPRQFLEEQKRQADPGLDT